MRIMGIAFVTLGACGNVSSGTSTDAPTDTTSHQPGDLIWVRSLSAANALGIAEGPGGIVVSGDLTAPTDLGGGIMTPKGAVDLVVADYKADDASYIYQTQVNEAGGGSVFGFLTQADTQGNPLVYGVSYGVVDLGKGEVQPGDAANVAVADGWIGRYGSGAPGWVDRIVGPGEDKILSTATAPGGEIYAGGWFEQAASWNAGTLTSAGGRDMFVTRLNAFTGAPSATKQFGGTGRDEIATIAGDGTSLVLGCFFDDSISFGSALSITATMNGATPSLDACVVKLDASLTPVWAHGFGGTGEERGTVVAIDGDGDVYVMAQFQGQIAVGAINLVATDTDPALHDLFVAKLHGADGSVAWAVKLGAAGDDKPGRVVIDKAGHPVVAAIINGDAVIESLDAETGTARWTQTFASTGTDSPNGLAVGLTGDILATVGLGGAVSFDVPVIGPPGPASVAMRIAP